MVSLDELRDQLRDALAVFKAMIVDPVPADEVFFVRDIDGEAHVAGFCTATYRFPSWARWERVVSINLPKLADWCPCIHRPPAAFSSDVNLIEAALNSRSSHLRWSGAGYHVSLFSTFPEAFEVWEQARRLYTQLVVADTDFLKYRAASLGVSVSQLPSVGLCTLQYKSPAGSEVFPNGTSAVIPWVMLPEDAAHYAWGAPVRYTLRGVEGWSAERDEAVSTLIPEAGSRVEAFAAFNLAEQLVP